MNVVYRVDLSQLECEELRALVSGSRHTALCSRGRRSRWPPMPAMARSSPCGGRLLHSDFGISFARLTDLAQSASYD